MALFSFKKKKQSTLGATESKKARATHMPDTHGARNTENESQEASTKKMKVPAKTKFSNVTSVLIRPRITEKAAGLAEDVRAYVFDVTPESTKTQIKEAVQELYNVTAEKVRIVQVPSKNVRSRRGIKGVKSGGKKAYVFLKKGDSIEFV